MSSGIGGNDKCKITQLVKAHILVDEPVNLTECIQSLKDDYRITITERILINRCNDLNAKFE